MASHRDVQDLKTLDEILAALDQAHTWAATLSSTASRTTNVTIGWYALEQARVKAVHLAANDDGNPFACGSHEDGMGVPATAARRVTCSACRRLFRRDAHGVAVQIGDTVRCAHLPWLTGVVVELMGRGYKDFRCRTLRTETTRQVGKGGEFYVLRQLAVRIS
jgi:hypothetical protein